MDILFINLLSTTMAFAEEIKRIHRPTYEHSLRVACYCTEIARELNLGPAARRILFLGGMLHDFGKIKINKSILNKPSKLTEQEYRIVQTHSYLGFEYLSRHGFPFSIVMMALLHHERLDGGGYPMKLRDGELPLLIRILSVADAFDAMTSGRAYRETNQAIDAFLELYSKKGIHYDGSIIDAMVTTYQRLSKDETVSILSKTIYA